LSGDDVSAAKYDDLVFVEPRSDLHCLRLIAPSRAGVRAKCVSPDNIWK
jgi:hypothetical protein